MFNKTATYLRPAYYQQFVEGNDLGGAPAQDIESRIANALFTSDDDVEADDDAVIDDDQQGLPADDDAEAEDETEIEEPESDDEGEQTLASVLGIDDDKLAYDDEGNVVFNAIVDGKTQPVKMQDLVKSYQLEGHVNNKSIALENDRKEFEQTRDTAYGELATRLEHANKLVEMVTQSLTSEFQSIDWNSLRVTDPAEWSALRQQFSERLDQIDAVKNQLGKQAEELTAEQKQQQNAKYQQFMQGEINKMIADNPAWSDQTVMAKDVGEIGAFLASTYGFTPEEIANNLDSRLMRMIQDARQYRSGKKAVEGKKIPANVPKFRKPGQNNANRGDLEKARKVKAQRQNIKRSGGSIDSIAASLVDRM